MNRYQESTEPIETAYAHSVIAHLSSKIGGRGSCTPAEKEAAAYVAAELSSSGLGNIAIEPFAGVPSTYRPFVLIFSLSLAGTLAALAWGKQPAFLWIGVLANLLGFWGMLAESNLSPSWTNWLLPKRQSQNVVAILPAQKAARARVIIAAHLDSHRTPVFYSSVKWQRLFSILVTGASLSLIYAAVIFSAAAIAGSSLLIWAGALAIPMQAFALVMVASADFTPFSPGANDNASGVGVVLSLARRLAKQPLENTETYFVFTGCEEVGSYGIRAFLHQHQQALTGEALVIVPDEVGHERIKFLSSDGLIIKHRTHPRALALARSAQQQLPDIPAVEMVGLAYTDALPATKQGLVAITLCSVPQEGQPATSHWHQMSDTIENVNRAGLDNAIRYILNIIAQVDAAD